MITVLLFFLC